MDTGLRQVDRLTDGRRTRDDGKCRASGASRGQNRPRLRKKNGYGVDYKDCYDNDDENRQKHEVCVVCLLRRQHFLQVRRALPFNLTAILNNQLTRSTDHRSRDQHFGHPELNGCDKHACYQLDPVSRCSNACCRAFACCSSTVHAYYIISYHIISYHIISYHIISYHIISNQLYYIILYYIILFLYHIILNLVYFILTLLLSSTAVSRVGLCLLRVSVCFFALSVYLKNRCS